MKKIFLILFTVFSVFMIRAEETDALRKAATGGDAYSQFRLGNEYFYGTEARKENRELAVYWFKKAADQGLPEAQLNYAICLERGLGIKADPVNAAPYYRKAADQGNNTAALNLALLYLYGSGKQMEAEPAKAVPILQKLSEQKIAAAMIELSAFQLNQQEVTTETRNKAFQMLLEASTLPDATAKGLRMLADCYYAGLGTEQDPQKTISLLRRASKMNDPEAWTKLAFFYEHGGPVEQDKQKAFRLYRHAANAGLPFGQYKYAEFICDGFEEGKGLNAALEYYDKSAKNGCPQAYHRLGLFALEGIGMDAPDKLRAAEMFENAAKIGYPPSQYNLANMFAIGDGIPQDDRKAFFWFVQSAMRGHAPAMRQVGICYYKGTGCIKNTDKAVEWIRAAAKAGDFTAQRMIEQNAQDPW